MSEILKEIIEHKKKEIAELKDTIDERVFAMSPLYKKTRKRLKKVMKEHEGPGIIAEFKRHSPSKGMINAMAKPNQVAKEYQNAGAVAMSVLTDEKYFRGQYDDLKLARKNCQMPLLRKDFIIDPYQVSHAKALGADIILLIASALSPQQCQDLAGKCKELKLDVLLEIHNEDELGYIGDNIDFVGVNNRDLKTMTTDINVSKKLIKHIPDKYLKVSESGLNNPETVKELHALGFDLFLIGEYFMIDDAPGFMAEEFINSLG